MSRSLSIAISLAILVSMLLLFFLKLSPLLSNQYYDLNTIIDPVVLISNLNDSIELGSYYQSIEIILDYYCNFLHILHQKTQHVIYDESFVMVLILILPVVVYFTIKDGYRLKKNFLETLPNSYLEPIMQLIVDLRVILYDWIKDQLIIVVTIGGLTTIALYTLGVPYALTLGLALGLAHLIPYFGSIIGAFVLLTVVILDSGSILTAIALVVALATIRLIYQLLFSTLKSIKIIQIHPLFIVILLLIGAYMWGYFGLFFVIPFTTILFIILRQSYILFTKYNII